MTNVVTKKIFITGGTSGIGLNLAKLYLKAGYLVGICGRDLSKVPEEIIENDLMKLYECDVIDREKLRSVVKDFADNHLDIMVANAGVSVGNKTKIPEFSSARKLIETNVIGTLNAFEIALDLMLPQKEGHLVAIASVAGLVGVPKAAAYSASKAAIIKLCESYSIDLKEDGIVVTTIAPGFIDTPLTQKNNHKMPFIMSAEKAGKLIFRAINQRKVLYIFPFSMKLLMYILDRMPRFIYRWLMRIVRWGN